MTVVISYITGKVKTISNVASVNTKQNAKGTIVLEIVRTSGISSEILISTISSISIDAVKPAQHINAVYLM